MRSGRGNPLAPYVWYRKEQIPAYWAYAKRYELADRFFSAVYGPTGPEQLWSMSGSSAGFTSFESEKLPQSYGTGPPREYCDDPEERAYRFVRWRQARNPEVMAVEYESPRRLVNPRVLARRVAVREERSPVRDTPGADDRGGGVLAPVPR